MAALMTSWLLLVLLLKEVEEAWGPRYPYACHSHQSIMSKITWACPTAVMGELDGYQTKESGVNAE